MKPGLDMNPLKKRMSLSPLIRTLNEFDRTR